MSKFYYNYGDSFGTEAWIASEAEFLEWLKDPDYSIDHLTETGMTSNHTKNVITQLPRAMGWDDVRSQLPEDLNECFFTALNNTYGNCELVEIEVL